MNNKSRVKNSVTNAFVTLFCQVLTLGLGFIVRTFFINKLGTSYLGINGLYTNILTVLSLAELGIGSAIGFSLYKPIAENDKDKISALMYFYKQAYRIIFVVVTLVGLSLVPFLKYLITTDKEIDHLVLYYVLFLANSSLSYLFAYKGTLLQIDQNVYITKILHTIFSVIQNVGQLAILFLTKNFTFYIVVQIACTLMNNIAVSIIVDRKYGFIKKNKTRLEKNEQRKIFKNIKAMLVYKIGGILVNNTDNILISKIISITAVGLYSNYTLIVYSLTNFLDVLLGSITASIGSYNVNASPSDSKKLFEAISLFNYWVYGFSTVALYSLLDNFIHLWLSTDVYLLDHKTLVAIVLSFFIIGITSSTSMFRTTTGLFKQTKYIFLITSLLNLVLSVILGIKTGLCGIIFATSISKLLTNVWFEPYRLYKDIFKESCIPHFLKRLKITVLAVISCVIIKLLFNFIPYLDTFTFIIEAGIVVIVPNTVFLLAYFRTEEFKYIFSKFKPFWENKVKTILHR